MIKKRILSLWISLCVICIAGAQEKELAYCNRQIHKTLKAIGTSSKLPRAIEAGKSSWDMVSAHDWTSGFFPPNERELLQRYPAEKCGRTGKTLQSPCRYHLIVALESERKQLAS